MRSQAIIRGASAVGAALALAVGVMACGSDDGGQPSIRVDESLGARVPVSQYYAGIRAGVGADVCKALTRAAQREAALSGDEGATCAQVWDQYLATGAGRARGRARVIGARVDGNRAVVTVEVPTARKPIPVVVVKEDGRWKLPPSNQPIFSGIDESLPATAKKRLAQGYGTLLP